MSPLHAAAEFIRQIDINRTLNAAGRITELDRRAWNDKRAMYDRARRIPRQR